MAKTYIVTGASSGIGYLLAKTLTAANHQVIGCSRNLPNEAYDWEHFSCDLSDPNSIKAFSEIIYEKYESIHGIIHVAGYGIGNAIEYTTFEEALNLFKVNVLGASELSRLCLNKLRQTQTSKIIFIGSVAGDITIPFQGYYSMTKAALTHMSNALRMELKPFKIDVSIVLPGDTKTDFPTRRISNLNEDALYKKRIKHSIERMTHDELNGMHPKHVVKVICKQLKKKRMKAKVTVGIKYKIITFLFHLLPYKFKYWIIYKLYAK
jgi:short-subunit dehydrogenase